MDNRLKIVMFIGMLSFTNIVLAQTGIDQSRLERILTSNGQRQAPPIKQVESPKNNVTTAAPVLNQKNMPTQNTRQKDTEIDLPSSRPASAIKSTDNPAIRPKNIQKENNQEQ